MRAIFAVLMFLSTGLSAQTRGKDIGMSYYITPCSSWWYEANGNGYTCRYPSTRIQVPDARDIESTLQQLRQRIEYLERRVQILEAANQ